VNDEDMSIRTGISEHTVRKYRHRALQDDFVIPYWLVSQIGLDNYYQVCIQNTDCNQRLVSFFDTLPKVKVMKSKEFCRYLLFLPAEAIEKLKRNLKIGEKKGEFEIIWRRDLSIDSKTIVEGVNLINTHNTIN
jgi:hypothetical protein